MEEKCKYCGKTIGVPANRYEYGSYCDGVQTLGPDPFAEEIRGDSTEYWECAGERYESAMDI